MKTFVFVLILLFVVGGGLGWTQTDASPSESTKDSRKNDKKKSKHPINPMDTGGPRLRGGSDTTICPATEGQMARLLSDLNGLEYSVTTPVVVPSEQDVEAAGELFDSFERGKERVQGYQEIRTRGGQGVSIFKRVAPSVVLVVVGKEKQKDVEIEGLGSGVIVDPKGYIVTNWHVVNGHSLVVVFLKPVGGAAVVENLGYSARVVAVDSTADLALLKVVKAPANLPFIPLEEPSRVEVAEDIHIIGHPEGKLWSYTTGVISQIRDDYRWVYRDRSKHEAKVLQLQTAINPGNSGGPVVDDEAKIIGLVAASTDAQNLNYAIAVDAIRKFVKTNTFQTRGESGGSTAEQVQGKAAEWNGFKVVAVTQGKAKIFQLTSAQTGSVTQIYVVAGRTFERTGADQTFLWRSWSGSGELIEAYGGESFPTELGR